jgi:signal transduction histidine kinase
MNLAQLALDAKNNPAQTKGIADAESLVQHLSREIRTTSYLLHPPLLDESGLASALNWYVQGLKERSGLDVDLRIPEKFDRLPADMELVIFRIVQESLTNVHRHSGSKSASIRVAREADKISVEVRDQGRGMPPEKLAEIQSQGSGVGISGTLASL